MVREATAGSRPAFRNAHRSLEESRALTMATVILHHQVTDYDTWRRVFDSAAPFRREHGERSAEVFRDANDPNRITLVSDYTSLDAARTYFDSDGLKAKMAEAGVAGKPELHFLENT